MNETPLFSVLIPLYNKVDVIARTLESVFAQRFGDFEIVVVDDGSTDGSVKIVEQYVAECAREQDVRIIRKSNGGVSSARNEGVRRAKGKFIAFLDADDIWLPDHLSAVAIVVDANPDARVIASGYCWGSGDRALEFRGGKSPYCIDLFRHSAFTLPVHTSGFVADRELLLSEGGFDERYSFFEDYLMFFKLATRTLFYFTGKVTENHTADAKERLTGEPRAFDPADFPHYQYVSDLVQRGVAGDAVLYYAGWRALENISQDVRRGDSAGIRMFAAKCPGLIRASRAARCLIRLNERGGIVRLLGQMLSYALALYFKLRRHSIVRKVRQR